MLHHRSHGVLVAEDNALFFIVCQVVNIYQRYAVLVSLSAYLEISLFVQQGFTENNYAVYFVVVHQLIDHHLAHADRLGYNYIKTSRGLLRRVVEYKQINAELYALIRNTAHNVHLIFNIKTCNADCDLLSSHYVIPPSGGKIESVYAQKGTALLINCITELTKNQ